MNLQLFGLGKFSRPFLDLDDGTGNGGVSSEAGDQSNNQNSDGGQKSFDDILKDSNYQTEFEKRMSEAIKSERAKWEADSKTKIDEVKTEEKRVADIERREKELNTRELKVQADTLLTEKNLPKSLAEIVIYENAETCIKSIEAIETAFNEAIENAVNERLRGGKPQRGGQKNIVDYSKMSDAEYYAATYKNKK